MINKEAIAPVKSVDKVPEIIDLKPSDINSFFLLGAMDFKPANTMPKLAKFANPHNE